MYGENYYFFNFFSNEELNKELLLDATRLGTGQAEKTITLEETSEIADLKKHREIIHYANTRIELKRELEKLKETHPDVVERTIEDCKNKSKESKELKKSMLKDLKGPEAFKITREQTSEELNKKNISNTATDQSREPTKENSIAKYKPKIDESKENPKIKAMMMEYFHTNRGIVAMIFQLRQKLAATIDKLIEKFPELKAKYCRSSYLGINFNLKDLENDPRFNSDVQKLLEDYDHYHFAHRRFVFLQDTSFKTIIKDMEDKITKIDSKLLSDRYTIDDLIEEHRKKYDEAFFKK